MENRIILLGAALVIIIYFVKIFLIIKKDKIYLKKLKEIYAEGFDPAKALTVIEEEISQSNHARVSYLLLDKFFILIWLGRWQEANQILSRTNQQKLSEERLYRLQFNVLLLKFLSLDTNRIEETYNAFIRNSNYSKYWKDTLELQILSCLYTLYVEKDRKKYILLYQELIDDKKISLPYLGILYLSAGIANYELCNVDDAVNCFSKAHVYGEKTFVEKAAKNILQSIHDN